MGLLITLDNRSVKTPGGKPLLIPKNRRLLAHMIAGEWESVQKMRTYAIPLVGSTGSTCVAMGHKSFLSRQTSLSARAIEDLTDAEIRAKVINDLLKYFQTDTVCFREPYPINLVELQKKYWDPLIAWVKEEFGCDVKVTEGIEAMTQEAATVEALKKAAEAFDPFELAGWLQLILSHMRRDGRTLMEEFSASL